MMLSTLPYAGSTIRAYMSASCRSALLSSFTFIQATVTSALV
jgi:hypothetical protein